VALWMLGPDYESIGDRRLKRTKTRKQHEREVYALVDKRDGMTCRCCSGRMTKSLTIEPRRREHHHVVPRSAGGVTETWNIVAICFGCHEQITRHQIECSGNADDELRFTRGAELWRSPAPTE